MAIEPAELDDLVIPTANRRSLSLKQLLLFLIISILVHGLGLFLFALDRRSPITEEETESKPIDFVVVPEESEVEPPPETEKRATENSVVEPDTEPEETTKNDAAPMPVPAPEPTPEPVSEPEPVSATAPAPEPEPAPETETEPKAISEPEPTPAPQPEPAPAPEPQLEARSKPEQPPNNSQSPVLTDRDPASTPIPEPTSEPNSDVATNLPPQTIPEPEPPQTAAPTNPSEGSASDLLGGNYKKTLADGGDTFFSPEALEYNAVLSPQELELLKGFDLEGYQRRLYNKVKRNWQPSFSEKYTTFLTFNIKKNGQISQLQVVESSGSAEFDRIAVEAVKNATPFETLPSDFPLEHLKFKYQFYLY